MALASLGFTCGRSALATADDAVSLYVSCPQQETRNTTTDGCYDAYLRQELSYFDFVHHPRLATHTLVIARQPAGNGGERFTVTAVPREGAPGTRTPITRAVTVEPGAPAHDARRALLQVILTCLRDALAGTRHEAAFQLSLPPRDSALLSHLEDPWDYWVIAPSLGGTAEAGSGFYWAEFMGSLTTRRITDDSKLRLRGTYMRRFSGYRLEDGSRVSGDVYDWTVRGLYGHSMSQRWTLGGVVTGRTSEFENLRGHVHGGPLVEFNVFPYAQNATRQLRLAYQAGAWANWYFEPNVPGHEREVRPYHALSLIADLNQPWGSVQWIGQLNSFVDDPELYRLSTGAILALRLVQGFSVSVEGEASLVRDLVNLRGRQISDLELLLWTAQQPTDFQLEALFALTYTFGSVHNTIVNPRFGRVDLDEE